MEKITSKNNDLIKSVKKLLSSSKERKEKNCFVLEGARLVFDALNSFYRVKCFLITESAFEKYGQNVEKMIDRADNSYLISNDIAERLGDTKSSQGVFAVCEKQKTGCCYNKNDKLIALDNVQDPGNLGTILRTAEALGIHAVIVGGGCDVYNPKVLRASMGSVLRISIIHCVDLSDKLQELKNNGFAVYGTVPDRAAKSITDIPFNNGAVCVIGNEANGISDDVKNICSELVTIKMLGNAESLNASVAASITMWEMLR